MTTLADTTVALLVGGQGTRLRSVISETPKCLCQINGRSLLSYLLDQLVVHGVNKVVLCTGYKGDQVKQAMGSSYGKIQLYYSQEDSPLGTAGAVKQAMIYLDSDPIMVMNGDSYCGANLNEYHQWFIDVKASASLLLTQVPNAARYGSVRIDGLNRIIHFAEKRKETTPGLINAGIYLLNQEVITSIPTGRFCSLEKDIFPQRMGKAFYGYAVDTDFLDIGTPESYAQASEFFSGIPV